MRQTVAGVAVIAAIVTVATAVGHLVPVVGAPVCGIVLGIAAGAVLRRLSRDAVWRVDVAAQWAARYPLQIAIVLLGSTISLHQVTRAGLHSLPVMLGTMTVALVGALVLGRVLGVSGDTRTLIGAGTAICGASAIAAVTPVIAAAEVDVAYAIGTIFTFNVAAVLLYPTIGHLLGLSQHAFGLWAGTAINDTSSVVAASSIYGSVAGTYGVVVKLTRSLMIVPLCIGIGIARTRRSGGAALQWRRMLPLFLIGFVLASALNSAGGVPTTWHQGLSTSAGILITVALSAIGLSTRPSVLVRVGPRPLILGGVLWATVGVASLLLQAATGTL